MTRDKPARWWGVPIVVVMAVVLCVGLWLIQGATLRSGAAWGDEVLRRGTATITDCRPAVTKAFLDHTCATEIEWQDEPDTLPRDVRPAEPPYRVWSTTSIEGEHEVVTHQQAKGTRGGRDREAITTVDHPAGTSRGWVVFAYLGMILTPLLAGALTMRILMALGIAPAGKNRTSRQRQSNDAS